MRLRRVTPSALVIISLNVRKNLVFVPVSGIL
jgi:hypothetical protein